MTAVASPATGTNGTVGRRPRGPASRVSVGWLLLAGAAFALAAALILWTLSSADERTDVLVVVEPVAAGEPLTEAIMGTTRIASDDGFGRIYVASQRASVIGAIAVTDLEPGDLLGPSVLAARPAANNGERLVGVVLRTGRYPVELKAGDTALAVNIDPNHAELGATIPVRIASVSVSETLEASVTMAAATASAPELGGWAGRDQVVLVVAPLGVEG